MAKYIFLIAIFLDDLPFQTFKFKLKLVETGSEAHDMLLTFAIHKINDVDYYNLLTPSNHPSHQENDLEVLFAYNKEDDVVLYQLGNYKDRKLCTAEAANVKPADKPDKPGVEKLEKQEGNKLASWFRFVCWLFVCFFSCLFSCSFDFCLFSCLILCLFVCLIVCLFFVCFLFSVIPLAKWDSCAAVPVRKILYLEKFSVYEILC